VCAVKADVTHVTHANTLAQADEAAQIQLPFSSYALTRSKAAAVSSAICFK